MIKIVTDSSVGLPQDLIDRYDISLVPLSVMVDSVLYSDLDLKDPGQFLTLMNQSKHLPKTSQPPVGLFAETYDRLTKQGADDIIAIHLAGSLSGTIEASRQGALLSGARVTVLDSETTDQALGFQVLAAAQLAAQGASKEEILVQVATIRQQTELYIGVSNLENLVKGGRVSRVSGLIGSLFNIRVLMQMTNSQLHPLLKGRGHKTFTRWFEQKLLDLSQRQVRQLGISYAGDDAFAREMAEQLTQTLGLPVTILETASVIQTHTGAGAFALMVVYDDEIPSA